MSRDQQLRPDSWRCGLRATALLALLALPAATDLGAAAADTRPGLRTADARPIAAGTWLVMVETPDCGWCKRWHAEIGPAYAKSNEGRRAPLDRRDRRDPVIAGFAGVVYTPTFILVRDGREIDRLVGYPGAMYFWSELDAMLDKLPAGEPRPAADPGTRADAAAAPRSRG